MANDLKMSIDPLTNKFERIARTQQLLIDLVNRCNDLRDKLASDGKPLSADEKLLIRTAQLPEFRGLCQDMTFMFLNGDGGKEIVDMMSRFFVSQVVRID